ncbi:unnamed protein product [Cyclocybe aegerita]|uniref:Uncharacterized protein n=1 Tax=Cyclocybe aegerita TaxID=1973307 RepID=A0A8S0XTD8_CYCAE|nr:unnamed protein product [Cyclocybe aegerita]
MPSYLATRGVKMPSPHCGTSFVGLRPAAALNIGVAASLFAASRSQDLIPFELDPNVASLIAATYVAGSVAYFARDVYSSTLFQDILSRRSGLGRIIDTDLLLPNPEALVHDAKVHGPACMRISQLAAFEYERAIRSALTICASNDGPGMDLAIVAQGEGVCSPDDAPPIVDSMVYGPACMRRSQLSVFMDEKIARASAPEDAPPVVDSKVYGPACTRPSQLSAFMDEKIVCASGDGPRRSSRLAAIAARIASGGSSSPQGGGNGPDDEPGNNGSGGNGASDGNSRQPTLAVVGSDGSKKPQSKKKRASKRARNNDSPPPPPPLSPPSPVEDPEPANNGTNAGWTSTLICFILGALFTAALKSSYTKRLYASIRTRATKQSRRKEQTVVMSRTTAFVILATVTGFAVTSLLPNHPPGAVEMRPQSYVEGLVPLPQVTKSPMRLVVDKSYYTLDYRSMATTTAQATSLPSSAADSFLEMGLTPWVLLVMALPIFAFIAFQFGTFIGRALIKVSARRAEPTKLESMPISSPNLVSIYIPQGVMINFEQPKPQDPFSGISDHETPLVDVRTKFSFGPDSAGDSDSEVPKQVIDKGRGKAVDLEEDEAVEAGDDEADEVESFNSSLEDFEDVPEELEEVKQMLSVDPPVASSSKHTLNEVESVSDSSNVSEKMEEVSQMPGIGSEALATSSKITLDSPLFVAPPPPIASSSVSSPPAPAPTVQSPSVPSIPSIAELQQPEEAPVSSSTSASAPPTTATTELPASAEGTGVEVPGRRRRKRRQARSRDAQHPSGPENEED